MLRSTLLSRIEEAPIERVFQERVAGYVLGQRTRVAMLTTAGDVALITDARVAAARSRRRGHPVHRIQVQPIIPRGRQSVEEIEPRLGIRSEFRILGQLPFERLPHLWILGQHVARNLFRDVRLHVLLLFERRVEKAPGRE